MMMNSKHICSVCNLFYQTRFVQWVTPTFVCFVKPDLFSEEKAILSVQICSLRQTLFYKTWFVQRRPPSICVLGQTIFVQRKRTCFIRLDLFSEEHPTFLYFVNQICSVKKKKSRHIFSWYKRLHFPPLSKLHTSQKSLPWLPHPASFLYIFL
jgi:hypothetical protein